MNNTHTLTRVDLTRKVRCINRPRCVGEDGYELFAVEVNGSIQARSMDWNVARELYRAHAAVASGALLLGLFAQ